jgi:hypothetical protein
LDNTLVIFTRMAWRVRALGGLLTIRESLINRCGAAEESDVIQRIHHAIAALQEDQFADCREEGRRLHQLYSDADGPATVRGNPWSDGTTYLLLTLSSGDPSLDTREARQAAASAVMEDVSRIALDGGGDGQ